MVRRSFHNGRGVVGICRKWMRTSPFWTTGGGGGGGGFYFLGLSRVLAFGISRLYNGKFLN